MHAGPESAARHGSDAAEVLGRCTLPACRQARNKVGHAQCTWQPALLPMLSCVYRCPVPARVARAGAPSSAERRGRGTGSARTSPQKLTWGGAVRAGAQDAGAAARAPGRHTGQTYSSAPAAAGACRATRRPARRSPARGRSPGPACAPAPSRTPAPRPAVTRAAHGRAHARRSGDLTNKKKSACALSACAMPGASFGWKPRLPSCLAGAPPALPLGAGPGGCWAAPRGRPAGEGPGREGGAHRVGALAGRQGQEVRRGLPVQELQAVVPAHAYAAPAAPVHQDGACAPRWSVTKAGSENTGSASRAPTRRGAAGVV